MDLAAGAGAGNVCPTVRAASTSEAVHASAITRVVRTADHGMSVVTLFGT